MNPIMKLLWKWQSKKKLAEDDLGLRYNAIMLLGELGSPKDVEALLPLLGHDSQIIRNAASASLKLLVQGASEEKQVELEQRIVQTFEQSQNLVTRISVIEVLREFSIETRERLLSPLVKEVEHDLLYVALSSLADTRNIEILNDILKAGDSTDLVLRRVALETWFTGISSIEFEEVLNYCSNNLHYLIRTNYELQMDGEFLKKVLSYSSKSELPEPKAYPDFIIRYLNSLLSKWTYDPEAYASMHAIVVPSYFTFSAEQDTGKPFIIL